VGKPAIIFGRNSVTRFNDHGIVDHIDVPNSWSYYDNIRVVKIPFSLDTLLGSGKGLWRLTPEGKLSPALPRNHPGHGEIKNLYASRKWNAVLIKIPAGIRMLEEDGRFDQLGGGERALKYDNRFFVKGDRAYLGTIGFPPNLGLSNIRRGRSAFNSEGVHERDFFLNTFSFGVNLLSVPKVYFRLHKTCPS